MTTFWAWPCGASPRRGRRSCSRRRRTSTRSGAFSYVKSSFFYWKVVMNYDLVHRPCAPFISDRSWQVKSVFSPGASPPPRHHQGGHVAIGPGEEFKNSDVWIFGVIFGDPCLGRADDSPGRGRGQGKGGPHRPHRKGGQEVWRRRCQRYSVSLNLFNKLITFIWIFN